MKKSKVRPNIHLAFQLLTLFVSSLPLTLRFQKMRRNSIPHHSSAVQGEPLSFPARQNIWKASSYCKLLVIHLNWQTLSSTSADCSPPNYSKLTVCRAAPEFQLCATLTRGVRRRRSVLQTTSYQISWQFSRSASVKKAPTTFYTCQVYYD